MSRYSKNAYSVKVDIDEALADGNGIPELIPRSDSDREGVPRDADNWRNAFEGELFCGRGYTGHVQ